MEDLKSGLWVIQGTAEGFRELAKAARTLGLTALANQLDSGCDTIQTWTDLMAKEIDKNKSTKAN